jgi:hypothetical protein
VRRTSRCWGGDLPWHGWTGYSRLDPFKRLDILQQYLRSCVYMIIWYDNIWYMMIYMYIRIMATFPFRLLLI